MEERQIILVVNADDFGLSKGINKGILKAYKEGILRSTSLMPNGNAFDDAVEIAKENSNLGVGIHLSLVAEKALSSKHLSGNLVDSNGFLPPTYKSFASKYLLRRFNLQNIKCELEAQFEKALSSGIKFTHIDSHQHLHIMPEIFEEVCKLAKSASINVIRTPYERNLHNSGFISIRNLQLKYLVHLSKRCRQIAKNHGINVADNFMGLGYSGDLGENNLLECLKALPKGINEIMCHPGIADEYTYENYKWEYNWEKELAALTSNKVIALIEERGIILSDFSKCFSKNQ